MIDMDNGYGAGLEYGNILDGGGDGTKAQQEMGRQDEVGINKIGVLLWEICSSVPPQHHLTAYRRPLDYILPGSKGRNGRRRWRKSRRRDARV